MTDITAEIICDSIARYVPRLPTFKLRYPRFIHAELMTHRVFSRNARSSRAVPIATMIREAMENPVIPLHWGAAQAGMQALAECNARVESRGDDYWISGREGAWLSARDAAVDHARAFMDAGYAKQLVNRLLEPFLHIDTLVTSTELENWFALRDHKDAEPHIQLLAKAMRVALDGSTPTQLDIGKGGDRPWGGWHLPYVDQETVADALASSIPDDAILTDVLRKVSTRRCARISYKPFDGSTETIEEEIAAADKLAASGHWSPFEHQATPDTGVMTDAWRWRKPRDHGNFVGWRQNRRIVEREMREAA